MAPFVFQAHATVAVLIVGAEIAERLTACVTGNFVDVDHAIVDLEDPIRISVLAEAFEKRAAAQQGTSDHLASADEHVP